MQSVVCFVLMRWKWVCSDAMLPLTGHSLHIAHNLDWMNPAGAPAVIWVLLMYQTQCGGILLLALAASVQIKMLVSVFLVCYESSCASSHHSSPLLPPHSFYGNKPPHCPRRPTLSHLFPFTDNLLKRSAMFRQSLCSADWCSAQRASPGG